MVVEGFDRFALAGAIGGETDIEVGEQFSAVAEAALVDSGGEAEVGDTPFWVGEVSVGLECGEAGWEEAGPGHGGLFVIAGDHDVRGEVSAFASGTEGDETADVGHLDGATGDLAGEGVLSSFGVVVDFHLVVHGANDGKFVGDLGGFRQEFRELHACDIRGNGFVGASVFGGCVRFGVPGVHVGQPTLLEDDQDAFRAAEVASFGSGYGCCEGIWREGGQHSAESDADEAASGLAQQGSTRDVVRERGVGDGVSAH